MQPFDADDKNNAARKDNDENAAWKDDDASNAPTLYDSIVALPDSPLVGAAHRVSLEPLGQSTTESHHHGDPTTLQEQRNKIHLDENSDQEKDNPPPTRGNQEQHLPNKVQDSDDSIPGSNLDQQSKDNKHNKTKNK